MIRHAPFGVKRSGEFSNMRGMPRAVKEVTIHETTTNGGNHLDTLLAHYARGALSPPLHVLVESHLALRPESRPFVGAMESVVASAITEEEPVAIANRDERLAAIFHMDDAEPQPRPEQAASVSSDIPHALGRYLGCELNELQWRSLLPGVKECRIADNEQGEATLYWIKGGRKIPSHTHEGSEYTLVLKGAFSDVNGRYERGDIAIADMDVDHCPVADPGEDCFCFAVTDAPLKLTGPIGRIVQRFFVKQ